MPELSWKRLKTGAYRATDDAGNLYLICPRHSDKGQMFEGWFRRVGHDGFGAVMQAAKLKDVKATQQHLADQPEYWAAHAERQDPREARREATFKLELKHLRHTHFVTVKVNANRYETSHLHAFLGSEAAEQKVEAYLTKLFEEEITRAEWGYDPKSYPDG